MRAIQVNEFGGPEVMELLELPDPEPADGEVVVDIARAGINFADTHQTRNDYLAEQTLPMIPGGEVAGTVGGRRVAAMLGGGAYAEKVAVPEAWLVPVPDEVTDDQAAGLLLQGVTAHALVNKCARLQDGETVVIEAAAGGTGALSVQIAKKAGARVIALASSEEKRATAERLGADATVDSRADNMKEAILEANGGEPVNAVLQMSGGDAFQQQLRTLAPFGRMVAFGIASREEPEVRIGHLMRNSRAVIGFWLVHMIARREELVRTIGELMSWVAAGELEVLIGGVYPLGDAAKAHEDIISRTTQGKLLLDPSS